MCGSRLFLPKSAQIQTRSNLQLRSGQNTVQGYSVEDEGKRTLPWLEAMHLKSRGVTWKLNLGLLLKNLSHAIQFQPNGSRAQCVAIFSKCKHKQASQASVSWLDRRKAERQRGESKLRLAVSASHFASLTLTPLLSKQVVPVRCRVRSQTNRFIHSQTFLPSFSSSSS